LLTFVGPDLVAACWQQLHVFCRRGTRPQWLGRGVPPPRDRQQRSAHERLPQDLQHRVGSARGSTTSERCTSG
jgi:hypothetical protein